MKKNIIKAFTLVEMLIVIVIIGILIASLMPRMQTAQGRARDVARKNDLAQIQTAIITSAQDRGEFPGMQGDTSAVNGMLISEIEGDLQTAGMTQVPGDPNRSNINYGLDNIKSEGESAGQYLYMVTTRNGVRNGGFVLMAKTEVEGGSNWVVCGEQGGSPADGIEDGAGRFAADDDVKDVITCNRFVDTSKEDSPECGMNDGECKYSSTSQLRYILIY